MGAAVRASTATPASAQKDGDPNGGHGATDGDRDGDDGGHGARVGSRDDEDGCRGKAGPTRACALAVVRSRGGGDELKRRTRTAAAADLLVRLDRALLAAGWDRAVAWSVSIA
jgi:hypothetical protein